MEQNDKDLVKSLISIIDETIGEVEEIRKSKFAASEIKLGEDEGLAGKSKNGSLEAKKKEEDEEEDEDEDKAEKGENEKADPDHGKFAQAPSVSKGENEKADPDHGKFAQAPSVSKADEDEDEDAEEKKKAKMKEMKEMKKSFSESESLMKSYVDKKMSSIEDKLSKMAAAIEAFANAPVQRRGIPSGVTPLHKSTEEMEPMNKAEVANKLFELKKSGVAVDSTDIFSVETGNQNTANLIATKYGLK